MLESLNNIVQEFKATQSKKEKANLLNKYKDDLLFTAVLRFLYDSNITTGISSAKINKDLPIGESSLNLSGIMDYLKENNTGRDADIIVVKNFIYANKKYQSLLTEIVTKTLRLGIDPKSINKVYKDFVPSFEVMLAKKYEDYEKKVDYPFILTEKLDGHRAIAFNTDDGVEIFSRQGQLYEGLVDIETEIGKLPKNYVYDGELIAFNPEKLDSKELFKKTSSIVRRDGVKKDVSFYLFDMLPIEDFNNKVCAKPCIDRKRALHYFLSSENFNTLKEVEMLYYGTDKEAIARIMAEISKQDKEGIMLNKADAPYVCKRTSDLLKIKVFNDGDMLVTQVIEGTGRNKGRLGAITVQFTYGGQKYTCNCGSGFSDEERDLYWEQPELILNKICTIGYFEVTKDENNNYSLRFPTWKSIIRDDKTEISMN
jgi:DNA ligase 1